MFGDSVDSVWSASCYYHVYSSFCRTWRRVLVIMGVFVSLKKDVVGDCLVLLVRYYGLSSYSFNGGQVAFRRAQYSLNASVICIGSVCVGYIT